jgi:hypothetical protein
MDLLDRLPLSGEGRASVWRFMNEAGDGTFVSFVRDIGTLIGESDQRARMFAGLDQSYRWMAVPRNGTKRICLEPHAS